MSGARPSRRLGAAAPLGTTRPSASSYIGQTARHRRLLTKVRPGTKPRTSRAGAERGSLDLHADRQIRGLVVRVHGVALRAVLAFQVRVESSQSPDVLSGAGQ